MLQHVLDCLHGLTSRQRTSFATCFHIVCPQIAGKGHVTACASSYCACHLRFCSVRLVALQTDNWNSTNPNASDVEYSCDDSCVGLKTQACGCSSVGRKEQDFTNICKLCMVQGRYATGNRSSCRPHAAAPSLRPVSGCGKPAPHDCPQPCPHRGS